MDQDKLDQIFRSSLYDHKTTIDKDELWESITIQESPKKKHVILLKFLSIALVVSAALGTALVMKNTYRGKSENTSVQNYTGNTKTAVTSPITHKSSLISEAKNKGTEAAPTKEIINASTDNQTGQSKNSKKSTSTIRSSSDKTITAEKKTDAKNKLIKKQSRTLESSEALLPKKKVVQHKDLVLNFASGTISNLAVTNNSLESPIKVLEKRELNKLASNRPIFQRNDKIECFDHRKKVDPFYLEAYTSVDVIKNRFTSHDNGDLNYLNERKATLTQLEGYRAGIRLKYLTRNGIYLKTGLELGAIRERFNKSEKTEREEIWPNQLLETITQSDTTILIYGDKAVTVIEEKNWKVWNTYKTLGIPLLVGYQSDFGKFTLGLEMGAIYNLLYDFEGMLLDDSYTPAMDPEYFRSQINTSLTGGIAIGYSLSDKYKLQALTSFKHNLSTISSQYNPLQQSNSKIGLGLGIEMKL